MPPRRLSVSQRHFSPRKAQDSEAIIDVTTDLNSPLRIPDQRERTFRFIVNADSGGT